MLGALAKIGRPQARPNRRVVDGRAADAIPHQRVLGVRVDGIVRRVIANIDLGVPVGLTLPLPVRAGMGMILRL